MTRSRGRRHIRGTAGLDQMGPVHYDKFGADRQDFNPHFKGLNERAKLSTKMRGVKITLVDHKAILEGEKK